MATVNAESVRAQALSLPTEQRAQLAQELIQSLGPPMPTKEAAGWVAEIERRVAAHDRGEGEAVEWRQSVAELLEQRRAGRKS